METPSPAAPNPVRTHQWVALDLLVLIHPSIAAGEHPHRRNRRFPKSFPALYATKDLLQQLNKVQGVFCEVYDSYE